MRTDQEQIKAEHKLLKNAFLHLVDVLEKGETAPGPRITGHTHQITAPNERHSFDEIRARLGKKPFPGYAPPEPIKSDKPAMTPAEENCYDIFYDYSADEIDTHPVSLQRAWEEGKRLVLKKGE